MHIRQSAKTDANDIENLAIQLIMKGQLSENGLKKSWINVDSTKHLVLRAEANIERNRRGDRLIECTEVLAVLEQYDETYLPTNLDNEYNEFILADENDISSLNEIHPKSQRHKIFAEWIVDTYGKATLSNGTGVIDVAGGTGAISRVLVELGIPSTLLDPNPRFHEIEIGNDIGDIIHAPLKIIPLPLNGDGSDLTSRNDDIGHTIQNCSFICGLHPDQATEPIVALALKLNVPFAIAPCCVMPSLFPNRFQRRYNNNPVRSYSAFCQYLLDMAPGEDFEVDYLPFVGRNKVIYRRI